MLAPGWLTHLDLGWAMPSERAFYEALAKGRTLVRYDKAGCGLSGASDRVPSMDLEIETLEAVVTAVGADTFDLFGASLGAAVAAKWAATEPDSVSRLVLYGGWAKGSDSRPFVLALWTAYAAGWAIALAATFMSDHLEFFGLRAAGWSLRGRPAGPQGLTERWLYAWVRHPMMLGLVIAFWATPNMTAGHLLFAAGMSVYVAVGVHYEEQDLRGQFGTAYDEYAQRVPGIVPHPTRTRPGARAEAG